VEQQNVLLAISNIIENINDNINSMFDILGWIALGLCIKCSIMMPSDINKDLTKILQSKYYELMNNYIYNIIGSKGD
jgi:hypothetical protein